MDNYKEKEHNLINNMKGILIILVVIGHFIETTQNKEILFWAKFIYSFHMTTFIFVSGYLAKNPKTNVKNLINLSLLYLTFNTIFRLIFSRNFTLAPFWTLWYLEALIVYRIILIFINKLKKNKKIKDNVFNVIMVFFIICSILISLFGVTHFTTNSIFNIKTPDIKVIKISMYLPIFFMGYMLSKDNLKKLKEFVDKSVIGNVLVVLGIIITSIFCVKYFNNIGIHYLYVNE